MGVITISRRMGSFGSAIGNKVAEELGMKCVHKKFIADIMKEYGFSTFNEIYDDVPNFWDRYDQMRVDTLGFMIKTMEAIGAHGDVVIVGRGGFEIFNDYNDVLNIRTQAPFDIRVQRKVAENEMNEKEAIKSVKTHDKSRKAFLKTQFKTSYSNTNDFDLVINTGLVDVDTASDLIVIAYKNLIKNGRNHDSKKLETLKIDPVLKALIDEKLESL
ncbi:MAG: cytidylate kinase-like family protein [Spirochaetaceae bacterium]|nr:cytidylate kinase-like family protein [Spirochaetaceae bacterium]